jgi:hypothetical protein
MSRPEKYNIVQTVWRSGRKNGFGDELVVAEGTVNDEPCYVMAWEVAQDRPECVSWNGKVSWFPRMYWLDIIPNNHIKVFNYLEGKEYLIKKDKHFSVIDGEINVKFKQDENSQIYHPSFSNVLYNSSAKTKAIEYVLWFNENQRQIDTHDRLLSTSKQARKRRRLRAQKRINTTND